jgi:hypothetical protein
VRRPNDSVDSGIRGSGGSGGDDSDAFEGANVFGTINYGGRARYILTAAQVLYALTLA